MDALFVSIADLIVPEPVEGLPEGLLGGGEHEVPHEEDLDGRHRLLVHLVLWLGPVDL